MPTPNLHNVLAQRPLGLAFDIDGTLSILAPTPAEARLYPGVFSLLEQARDQAGVHVAIVTGRAIDEGASMVNVDGLTYVGTHGLEWSNGLPTASTIEVSPESLAYVQAGKQLLDLAEQKLSALPGLIIERKRLGGSIHYRLAPDPEEARERILALLTEPAHRLDMRLTEGKCVIEIKSPVVVNKGKALARFVQRFALQGVVFAGDDRTDLDAVMEIVRLRQAGLAALSIAVKDVDTLPALLENADILVEGVAGMVRLLHEIVEAL
ncbi:MAG: trehalose-phosphatase [Ktedonobacteraceae bacterium]|nr:trehalose-phosphatase [Ktedonobacteraceae bacterium]